MSKLGGLGRKFRFPVPGLPGCRLLDLKGSAGAMTEVPRGPVPPFGPGEGPRIPEQIRDEALDVLGAMGVFHDLPVVSLEHGLEGSLFQEFGCNHGTSPENVYAGGSAGGSGMPG